jgi:hypothetical protein
MNKNTFYSTTNGAAGTTAAPLALIYSSVPTSVTTLTSEIKSWQSLRSRSEPLAESPDNAFKIANIRAVSPSARKACD